jgi:hypothetical protein
MQPSKVVAEVVLLEDKLRADTEVVLQVVPEAVQLTLMQVVGPQDLTQVERAVIIGSRGMKGKWQVVC